MARHTWHPAEVGDDGAPEPLDMWEQVARAAADDAGGAPRRRSAQLESIDVVYSQSWQYDDAVGAPGRAARSVAAAARYSGIGGSVPHVLAAEAARDIAAGDLDLALIVGAEALATVRRLKKAGEKPQWSFKPAEKRPVPDGHGVRPLRDHPLRLRGLPDLRPLRQRAAGPSRARPREHRAALGGVMAA